MRFLFLSGCVVAVQGHVRMVHAAGQTVPIRNANSPTGDGAASVATAGGNQAFGANGKGQVQDGAILELVVNYAAGHQSNANEFAMYYACGDTSSQAMSSEANKLSQAVGQCTGKVSGAPSSYPVPAPQAIVPGGYTIACTLPLQNNAAPIDCSAALLDQRDWGGIVDFSLLPAADPLPPPAPPPPFVTSAGTYELREEGSVDTSAADFTCCPISTGALTIDEYTETATRIAGRLEAQAVNCPEVAPRSGQPAPAATRTVDLSQVLSFTKVTGNKLEANLATAMAGQPFIFTVEAGVLSFANQGAEQPIICDGQSSNGLALDANGQLIPTFGGVGGGLGAGWVVLIIVIVIVALGGGIWFFKRRGSQQTDAPMKSAVQYQGAAPPPPAAAGLPPGWSEAVDPASGSKYYVNQATGATQWTPPAAPGPPPPPPA